MTDEHDDWPMLLLHPGNANSARDAGRDFARALAGAANPLFMLALGEQTFIVSSGIRAAGFSKRKARVAAVAFEEAARAEWRRISTAQSGAWGTA
jgi:hypothetical protein